MSLGQLSIDGGLEQKFLLGQLSGSPEFSFPVFLEHTLREDEAVSDYRVPQLESYVVPEGRDDLLWVQPGGLRTLIPRKDIVRKLPAKLTEDWTTVELGALDYEFHSQDGWIYRYRRGALVSLEAPSKRLLQFETVGIRITRIFQVTPEREVTLLEATDNDLGQPETISLGPVTHEFSYTEGEDLLKNWQASTRPQGPIRFDYGKDGLVSSVLFPGGDSLSYQWGDRRGEWQMESGLELPQEGAGVFLIGDDNYQFQYGTSKQGVNLLRTDVAGFTDGFVFNPRTQQVVVKNRDGGEVTRFFGLKGEEAGRLESARDARGRETVKLTYDEKGRVHTRTAAGTAPLRYQYDELDRLVKVWRMDELHRSFEYKGDFKKPAIITNALGHVIENTYNEAGQLTKHQDLDGAVYEFIYDDLGQLVEQKYPMGYSRKTAYDDFGRVTKVTHLDGSETTYDYTGENRLAAVTSGARRWDYQYNEEGLLSELQRDGQIWQKIEREKLAGLDHEVVSSVNSKGEKTVIELDAVGNIRKEVDPMGNETEYQHDKLGQLKGWKDGRGVVAEFERDALGRVAEVETEGVKPLSMAYDQTGRLTRRKTGEQDIQYRYNKAGQLRQIDYGKGEVIDYTYDVYGRILTASTSQGVKTTYTWDALDRKTSERNDIPGGVWTLVKWEYTSGGRKAMVAVYQNGDDLEHRLQETRYQYDLLGRYSGIFVNGEQKIWYDYDPKSRQLARKRFANGWTIDYGNHPNGRPASILAKDQNSKVIKDVTYVWGEDGKLASRTLDGVLHEYQYDQLGRLTAVEKRGIAQKEETGDKAPLN